MMRGPIGNYLNYVKQQMNISAYICVKPYSLLQNSIQYLKLRKKFGR